MQHESVDRVNLKIIIACERRALDKMLPPAERCAVPMKPGPLSDDASKWTPWNQTDLPPLPSLKFMQGIKIPNPWKFPGGIANA